MSIADADEVRAPAPWLAAAERSPGREGFGAFLRAIARLGPGRLGWAMALSTVAALSQGAGLLLLVPLLDAIGVSGSGGATGWMARLPDWLSGPTGAVALYVGVVLLAAVAGWARAVEAARLRLGFVDDLRRRIHAAVIGMEWSAFQRLRASDVTQILTQEIGRIGVGTDFVLRLSVWAIEVVVTVAVIVHLSPLAGALLLVPVAAGAVLARPLNRRSRRRGQALTRAFRTLQAQIDDDLTGLRLVKSMHLEPARRARFDATVNEVRGGQVEHVGAVAAASGAGRAVAAVAAAAGVAFAVKGLGMPAADAVVLALAFGRLMMVVLGVQEAWRNVLYALPAYAATMALLRHAEAAAEPAGRGPAMPPLRDAIVLEDVSFRHGADREMALDRIGARIPARSLTVISGPSGAGKSTLADIVLGLLAPDEGRVLIDGRPLDRAARRDWRRRVGYVPQDSFLFHDTIRANLRLGAMETEAGAGAGAEDGDAALWAALADAAADDFVRGLPEGLDTVVGDRGGRLSGGERQRIALARALVRRPELLVLDEPTSALDTESERLVLETLERLRGRTTIVIVTHRPAVLFAATDAIVLERGRLTAAAPPPQTEGAFPVP